MGLKTKIQNRQAKLFYSSKYAVIEGPDFILIAYEHYNNPKKTQYDLYDYKNIINPRKTEVLDIDHETLTIQGILDIAGKTDEARDLSLNGEIVLIRNPDDYCENLYAITDKVNEFFKKFINKK